MGALRAVGFFALTAVMVPVHVALMLSKNRDPYAIPHLYYRILLRILGLRVRVHGAMETKRPIMFVSNHTSYLDVPVLGALIPAAFVAKSEVADWPMIGWLAKLQGTLFVERRSSRVDDQRLLLNEHLARGQSLILFPEGTSTLGLEVLPFKSGLFSIADTAMANGSLTIQPVSIVCTELDGLPLTRAWRPFYSWYGDMEFVSHLWSVFKMGRFTIDVTFHPAVKRASFADRKALAVYCQQQVARGIEQSLSGRATAAVPTIPQLAAPTGT